ncbi:cytochrome c3 family protein [Desulfatitalea alkaliphila]|uniref:Respiratory nitrate reductase subunit gamma n=1 Tax=Desulfatitalea alkaliphila TaxID=2929485 RepID=A0AA41R2C1_9BACT|nr:respiratory nitrate reductase subunit gamma [Desulfatitalea alkaliphila]
MTALMLFAAIDKPMVSEMQGAAGARELVCLDCHRRPNVNTNEGVATSRAFCFSCHATPESSTRNLDDRNISLQVEAASFQNSPHRFVACVQCHTDVARSPHRTDMGAQCRDCHTVHGEGTASAPHLRVDCQACHFTHEAVMQDGDTDRIRLAAIDGAGEMPPLTGRVDHALQDTTDPETCRRCHHDQNAVGAPAAVLPAKSLLCVACHPASWSLNHPLFMLAALALLVGLLLMVRFWFVGSVKGEDESLHQKIGLTSEAVWNTLFSRKVLIVLKTLLLDIFLQRRILKESVQRWSMHALIFVAIVVRFLLSVFTGVLFSLNPDGDLALALIDKNHPFTAFFYDLSGLMILLGIAWAAVQRFVVKPPHVLTEIKDNIALGLIGLLVVLGFVAAGARIAMTGIAPEVAVHSFIGYPLSRLMDLLPLDWRIVYPWLWYAHAVVGLAFIASLPYGKLKHVINVPLTYLLEEVDGTDKSKRV